MIRNPPGRFQVLAAAGEVDRFGFEQCDLFVGICSRKCLRLK
jgi:hypothetical protein